jgi:hypothetical protein
LSLAAWAAVAGLLLLLGSRCGGALATPRDGALYRAVLYGLAGAVACHLLLGLFQLAGLTWTRAGLAAALLAAAALAHRCLPRAAEKTRLPSDLGWGDGLALFALLAFTLVALTLWIAIPDFVYHWGLKGQRFFLARGVDYAYLGRRWNWPIHPDYPNLLPELYAATALAAGRFAAPAMMPWTAVWFAGILCAAREALRRGGADRATSQAALALLALVLATFGLGGVAAGGADWMIALALAAALPPLLDPPGPAADLQIGVAAAFAAASKVEGVALGAILIGAQLARRLRRGPLQLRPLAWSLATVGLPFAAVALPWLAAVRHYHLFQEFNAGRFDPGRAAAVGSALLAAISVEAWHGFAFALALLPLLALDRRLRAIAAVVALQLAFYLYVYFTARVGVVFLVESTFPRLALHLLPAVLVGLAVLRPGGRREES